MKVTQSCLTLCDPMDCPWNSQVFARILEWVAFPFSRGIFPTQGSNPGLLHCRWIFYQLSHKGSPRILEWGAYRFSSRSSQPGNRTGVSCIAAGFFTNWAIREANSSELKPVEMLRVAGVTHNTLLRRRKRSLVIQQKAWSLVHLLISWHLVKCFLSSVSQYRKSMGPREEVTGTSDLQPVGQKHRWQPGWGTGVCWGGAWGGKVSIPSP